MTDWRDSAACLGLDTELWYADRKHPADQAVAVGICQQCPVRQACLEDAVTTADVDGIRGGLTESERRRLKSGRALKPHGTMAAFKRHAYRGEKPCAPCMTAYRADNAERQRAYRAKRRAA